MTSAPFERVAGPRPPLTVAAVRASALDTGARAAILVEGWSDQAALEALALRHGRSLEAEGIVVVPIGGVTNIAKFAEALGPHGLGLTLTGLYDAGEEAHVLRALERAGLGRRLGRPEAAALGFHVCDADLEDELIRALGPAAAEQLIEAQGELGSFRRFQVQPAQQGRALQAHLRRFMGTRAGRKIRYGALLVDATPLHRMPVALELALACAACRAGG